MWPANPGDRGNAQLPFRFALGFRRREALLLAWFGCEDSLRGALVLHLNLALGTSAGRVQCVVRPHTFLIGPLHEWFSA